jgi:CARDB
MKRIGFAALVALACASSIAVARAGQPRAELRGYVCHVALDPVNREISVNAVMRPVKGTKRMQLRFDLLGRASAPGTFAPVTGGDLGTWISPSNPTLGQRSGDVWMFGHPVFDLTAPAAYRFVVSFRWIGGGGRVLGTVMRQSKTCFQPELRPDLIVQSIVINPVAGHPKLDQYATTIENTGASGAGPFEVEFADKRVVKTPTVRRLHAHSAITINFVGPLCDSTSPPTVTVDPTDQVDVVNRDGTSQTVTCPSTG